MKKFIFLIQNIIKNLINLVQGLIIAKFILLELKEKDMEYNKKQEIYKVKENIKLNNLLYNIDPVEMNIKENYPGPGNYGKGVEMNKYG
jgi:hypothetical protein